jgi:putative membrane protein
MYWYGNGMTGWGYTLMWFTTVLLAILVIVGVVLFVRYLARPGRPTEPRLPTAPEQLLAQRYARGELDDDEYQHRLAVLHSGPPAS